MILGLLTTSLTEIIDMGYIVPAPPVVIQVPTSRERPPTPASIRQKKIVCAFCGRGRGDETACPGCGATETKILVTDVQ